MKIKRADGSWADKTTQQLVPEPVRREKTDIPTIIERYISLVGRAVKEVEAKPELQSKDINSIAALGKTIAMLQAVEQVRMANVNGKSVKELTNEELRQLAGRVISDDLTEEDADS